MNQFKIASVRQATNKSRKRLPLLPMRNGLFRHSPQTSLELSQIMSTNSKLPNAIKLASWGLEFGPSTVESSSRYQSDCAMNRLKFMEFAIEN
jgi:hypothetical protein